MPIPTTKKRTTKRSTQKTMTLKIGHRDIDVSAMRDHDGPAHEMVGIFKRGHGIIEIDLQQKPQEQGETLLHEVLHALVYDRNLSMAEDVEERVVDTMAKALCALIRDNPTFFDVIRSSLIDKKPLPLKD